MSIESQTGKRGSYLSTGDCFSH